MLLTFAESEDVLAMLYLQSFLSFPQYSAVEVKKTTHKIT